MQVLVPSSKPTILVLGIAAAVLSLTASSVAENLNFFTASVADNSEVALSEEIAALPAGAPLLIAPVVKPPETSVKPAIPKEMRKLAAKYDVTKIGDRNVGKGMNFYSLDKEMDLGREVSEEAEQELRIVGDPVISEYVNRLGQNLVRNSDAKVPFTIKVVDASEVNAFALPGGYFYVNTGLILAAENEAELAGVMAHEIAHVAARHATHNMSRRDLFNLCSLPAVFVAGPIGMAVREASEVALPMSFMKFSRDAEREADLLGMQYAYATGYDPAAMVNFFERMEAKEKRSKGFIARAFDSHPMTAERVRRAQEEMNTMLPAKDDYVVTTSEFNDVKARLTALVNHHVIEDADDKLPTLRKATEKNSEDERPTLKRGSGN